MRKFAFVLIFFLVGSVQKSAAKISFGASISTWAYEKDYIMQISPELIMDFSAGKSLINIDLMLPVFVGMNYESGNVQTAAAAALIPFTGFGFYFNGFKATSYNDEPWPALFSDPIYLITYIKKLSFQTDNFAAQYLPDSPLLKLDTKNLIWYNPYFDKFTGLVNRYLAIKFFDGTFQSSSLTQPGFFTLDYVFSPFTKSPAAFLQDVRITPLVWIDLGTVNQVDTGAGLAVSTGATGPDIFKLKFLSSAHFLSSHLILNETVSYRVDVGVAFLFQPLGVSLGYINKSPYHPYGPFLSPLYLSRKENDYSTNTKNHGIDIGLIPGIQSPVNASMDVEIYPETPFNFSLRGQLRYQWQKNYIGLAYIHENMKDFADLIPRNSDMFFEIDLRIYVVPDIFVVEWRNFFNFADRSNLKSVLSLMAFF